MWFSWTSGRLTIIAATLCALLVAGCSNVQTSGIDPSGDHILAGPPAAPNGDRSNERYFDQPLGQLPWDDAAVQIQQPRVPVASVGTEVVLIAGVCGPDGYLRTNRRLEWSIDPGSVGQFVAVGETGLVDMMLGDFNRPRKITNTYAIGSTLRANTRLNRGTCRPEENEYVLRGQGWISLTSPMEGTSHVTVVAPEVYRWEERTKSVTIHWVDAQWRFPPPAINPAGTKHVFTTTVLRQTSPSPCENWRVRYEIVDGPPAGFSPDGAPSVEVPTDSAGQASVEIFEKEPKPGTNKIAIQVIRPADSPGANGQRLIVGTGTTMKTWTGSDLAVKTTGPAAGGLGGTLNYRFDVSNPGDLAAKDVVVVNMTPEGLTYVGSNPPAEVAGRQLQWRLGELGARQSRAIDVSYRADKQGSIVNCCDVVAAGGRKVSDCATTTVGAASLDIRIAGPTQAKVGEDATFEITVKNLSQAPATKLVITDRFDQGFEHKAAEANNAIRRSLNDLAAGAAQRIIVTVRVAKPGRLCHTVEVTGKDINPASATACLTAAGDGVAPGAAVPPPTGPTPPKTEPEQPKAGPAQPKAGTAASPPPITVTKIGPTQPMVVGETARFAIELLNTGPVALQNVKVVDRCDPALMPAMASDGYQFEKNGGLFWVLETLPPNKLTKLEIHCTCQAAAENTCNRVTVTTADGGRVEAEACVEIRPAGAPPTNVAPPDTTKPDAGKTEPPPSEGLTLSVVGLRNPVPVGKELTYEIRVTNNGAASQRQLSVMATLPEGMAFNPIGTQGPDPVKFAIEGRTIRFDPLGEVRNGESVTYRVRVRAKEAGPKFLFHVELSGPALPQPLVKEEATEVF